MLMAQLADTPFTEQYTADDTAKLAYKLFSTVKSNHKHLYHISFKMTDTPGTLIRTQRAADHYFTTCDVVLIVFDCSMALDEVKIEQWT